MSEPEIEIDRRCTFCGVSVRPHAMFCPQCGNPIKVQESVPTSISLSDTIIDTAPAETQPVETTPAEEKPAETKPDADAVDADRATVPADAATIRHSDAAVSDSESRANLRNNQSGPVRASEDADRDSTGGTAPANGAPAAGVSGRQGTGTAPEAEGTK